MIVPYPPQPMATSSIGPTVTLTLTGALCPDHRRVGCEHSYTCPACGCGQTVTPDPCEAAA